MQGPLRRDEILSIEDYERVRPERRKEIIELKRSRRIAVGPLVTFVFENRQTALFQVQEILLAEGITREEDIRTEMDIYDVMIPRAGELRATMFIEIPEREERHRLLPQLVGIEDAVLMQVGNEEIRPRFHYWRETDERASPVNYAIFSLSEPQQGAFALPQTPVFLRIAHPVYSAEAELTQANRESLAGDLHD